MILLAWPPDGYLAPASVTPIAQHIVNGRPLGSRLDIKDDNFHTTFHVTEGWHFGDTYKFQATHFSPTTRTTYISAVNECLITPR